MLWIVTLIMAVLQVVVAFVLVRDSIRFNRWLRGERERLASAEAKAWLARVATRAAEPTDTPSVDGRPRAH